jgi:hypothetical protein
MRRTSIAARVAVMVIGVSALGAAAVAASPAASRSTGDDGLQQRVQDFLIAYAAGDDRTDLKADYANPASKTVGSEFVGTAISQEPPGAKAFVDVEARNPHVRFFDQTTNG